MKQIILFIFLLFPVCIHSQFFPTGFHSEIPPLPESAVFRQFAGYTPSLNTGAVNIPISLYDIQAGNFTLPISLHYYTSGIKVEAPADPVGYGWSLNPGLRITRTIRGRADEAIFKKVMYSTVHTGEDHIEFLYAKRAMLDYPSRTKEDIEFDRIIGTNTVIDTKYDIFTIHLPSGNHSFIYKEAGNIESLNPLLKIKEVMVGQRIIGFEVVDDKGISYYFGCFRGENDNVTPPHVEKPSYSKGYYTAWGLRKITMPDGKNQINITWDKALTRAYLTYPYEQKIGYMDSRPENGDINSHEYPPRLTTSGNYYEPENEMVLRIKEIEFPTGNMAFIYTNQNYKSILSSIDIKNHLNEDIKNIKFEYDTNNTLLLIKLSLSGEGTYKFSYNPGRFTNILSQDYWGYYNGKANHSTLLPNFKVGINYDRSGVFLPDVIHQFGYADRSIDRDYMQANMLTKVEYPTGGYSEFEYEPHIFQEIQSSIVKQAAPLSEGLGLRVCKITTKPDAFSPPVIKTYKYSDYKTYNFISTYDSFFDRYGITYTARSIEGPEGADDVIWLKARNTNLHAHSFLSSLYISNPLISYGMVEEYVNNTQKTVYKFSDSSMDEVSMEPRPFVRSYRNITGEFRPLIKRISYKKEGSDYIPLEEINYTYSRAEISYPETHVDFQVLNTIASDNGHFLFFKNLSYPSIYNDVGKPYYIINTYLVLGNTKLSKEEKITYIDDKEIIEKAEYTYNLNQLLSKKRIFSSDNQEITENYSYLNQTSYPMLTSRIVNDVFENKRFEYYTNNKYQIQNIKLYTNYDYESQRSVTFDNYTAYGRPGYITDEARKVVYIWSYKGQYPIAEIKNATYAQVKNVISQANLDKIADAYTPTTEQMNLVNSLRLQLPEAHVTTYTYQPLVGMKSVTDPLGITIYYSYHDDGRLAEIYRIEEGNKITLQRYDYNLINSGNN